MAIYPEPVGILTSPFGARSVSFNLGNAIRGAAFWAFARVIHVPGLKLTHSVLHNFSNPQFQRRHRNGSILTPPAIVHAYRQNRPYSKTQGVYSWACPQDSLGPPNGTNSWNWGRTGTASDPNLLPIMRR